MKKINVVLILIIIVIVLIFCIFLIKNNNSKNVIITQYEAGTDTELKRIVINSNSENDINKLNGYIEELAPLTNSEMVDLTLLNEIEIKYTNSISIRIQLGEKDYCYYINKEKNISSLSKLPNGLYEWVENKLK